MKRFGITATKSKRTDILGIEIGRVTEVKSLTNKLQSPMRNAGVERRQLHSMFFGQFGEVQISELSA